MYKTPNGLTIEELKALNLYDTSEYTRAFRDAIIDLHGMLTAKKIWTLTSVRVVPPQSRRPMFSEWRYRKVSPFTSTLKKAWSKPWKEFFTFPFIAKFKENWSEYNKYKFPIEARTWGFFFDKEVALKAARTNHSDLREGAYYHYVVVEGVEEGIFSTPAKGDQFFFQWTGTDAEGGWEEMPLPEDLEKIYTEYGILFQFTVL